VRRPAARGRAPTANVGGGLPALGAAEADARWPPERTRGAPRRPLPTSPRYG